MCLRGPGSPPELSSKANHQLKFPREFLLNPGWNPIASQDPFDKVNSQTSIFHQDLRLMWAMKSRLMAGGEKDHWKMLLGVVFWSEITGLTLHQNMAPKGKSVQSQEPIEDCDELCASSPLVCKEKVTGRHHPYASKQRMGHASSSREKIVDDEDENMIPTQSERNDEPRRDNFTAHEQGTQSNSEFTHPQVPLAQSMLNQYEMRQRKNKAFKAHNVAKFASHKEQQKWLKAEIPENVHGMRSAVHAHCLFLLKVRDKDFSSLPAPPSTEEREIAIQVDGQLRYVPKDVFNEP
ncbi:hypothetical protein O181_075721 [Austropuccinia psidii MF-1]|uniref:Uncharacterized protein n=1 Tax=Austropuccinia psidii MF-1 TaxID=1389203 RepID=A0A9Q3IAG0_9BASI|nr:hypothetical protein [Austropuccinia psidii MF-1]